MPAFIRKAFPTADLYFWANADDWVTATTFTKKINVIVLIDFIDFKTFRKQVQVLLEKKNQYFILLTEHQLSKDYIGHNSNVFHFNIPTPETEPLSSADSKFISNIIDNWRDAGDKLSSYDSGLITCQRRQILESLPPKNTPTNLFSIILGNNDDREIDRHRVYAYLEQYNLLEHCNYTINKNNNNLITDNPRLAEAYQRIKQRVLPSPISDETGAFYRYDHVSNLSAMQSLITSSKVYVALDNRPSSIGGFLTEKSLYGYAFKKPTIHIGCPDNEQVLQSFGFKPAILLTQDFNKLQDEDEKIQGLCKELEFIKSMSANDFLLWEREMQKIADHNYEIIIRLPITLLEQWAVVKSEINKFIISLN